MAVPVPVGVPEMTPAGLRDRLVGSDPNVVPHTRVPTPPVATSAWLYATPTVPTGKAVVLIVGAELEMTIDSGGGVVSVRDKESATCGVKLKVPVAEGVPEISPVEVLRLSPVGSVPVTLHVKGAVPVPLCSWSVWL